MPFAINEATRFISPTKTPEFLAAGIRIVSSPVADVVRPYGEDGLVSIASDAEGFAAALERSLTVRSDDRWLIKVNQRLSTGSWDKTWSGMQALIEEAARPAVAASETQSMKGAALV